MALWILTILCFLNLTQSCDFDKAWSYEDLPCSGWSLPEASDGQPGFIRTDRIDVNRRKTSSRRRGHDNGQSGRNDSIKDRLTNNQGN